MSSITYCLVETSRGFSTRRSYSFGGAWGVLLRARGGCWRGVQCGLGGLVGGRNGPTEKQATPRIK